MLIQVLCTSQYEEKHGINLTCIGLIIYRCDGSLGTCPGAVEDKITLTTGTAQLMDNKFNSPMRYQYFTDKLYIKISGFCVSCGQLTLNWFLLPSTSTCSTISTVSGTFSNNNMKQTLTRLALQVNERYKISIQASDMRNNTPEVVCTDVVIIKTPNQSAQDRNFTVP